MNDLAGPPFNPRPHDLSQRSPRGVIEAAQVRELGRAVDGAGAPRYSTLLDPASRGVEHGAGLR